jgi:hypothetical protein
MDRELPSALSSVERSALAEFFAGNLPAGQLVQRLGHSRSRAKALTVNASEAPALPTDSPTGSLRPATVPRVVRQGLLVLAVASAGVAVGMVVSARAQPADAGTHRNTVQVTHSRRRTPAVTGARAAPASSHSSMSAVAPAAPSVSGPRPQTRPGARPGVDSSGLVALPASRRAVGTRSAPAAASPAATPPSRVSRTTAAGAALTRTTASTTAASLTTTTR